MASTGPDSYLHGRCITEGAWRAASGEQLPTRGFFAVQVRYSVHPMLFASQVKQLQSLDTAFRQQSSQDRSPFCSAGAALEKPGRCLCSSLLMTAHPFAWHVHTWTTWVLPLVNRLCEPSTSSCARGNSLFFALLLRGSPSILCIKSFSV